MQTKKRMRRLISLSLSLILLITPVAASDALGSDRRGQTVQLAAGVTVTDNSLWSATYSDLRTEHYLTYTPNAEVTPLLWYGTQATSKATLSDSARRLREQGYRVVAGINGGFFNTDGTSVGLILAGGVIRSMDRWNYNMVGFFPDGTAFVDSNPITKGVSWVDASGQSVWLGIAAINASRDNGGVYLYNEDYGSSTQNSLTGVDVILEPLVSGQKPTMNSTMEFQVVSVIDSTQDGVTFDNVIPSGCYVLSANKNCDAAILDPLRALVPGTQVTLGISGGDSRWSEVTYGITGLYSLVADGQVVQGLDVGAAPRTALGFKADGSTVFYTIDGRQSGYSVGATYTQVAQRLIELGCVTAVALDGGGSTTIGATLPGEDTFTILNQPSDGSQRAVSNCLFLVTTASAADCVDRYYLSASCDLVLTGASVPVNAVPVDVNGYPVSSDLALDWACDGGSVYTDELGSATFTAGSQAGVYELTVSDQSATGSTSIRVLDQLSALLIMRKSDGLTPSALTMEKGSTVDLDAAGTWYNLEVAVDDVSVQWSVEGEIGIIDETGFFTAGEENATGAIVAMAGGHTVRIPVTVFRNDPFTDIGNHWSRDYVCQLYEMGLTTGVQQADGTFCFMPDQELTRKEILTFISRLLGLDVTLYEDVELPFEDVDSIPDWVMPHVKALYALHIFSGSANAGQITADMDEPLSREMVITMLGRMLAEQTDADLSVFSDAELISDWAVPYVKTFLAQNIVGSAAGVLSPQSVVTRGELAMLLVRVSDLELVNFENV